MRHAPNTPALWSGLPCLVSAGFGCCSVPCCLLCWPSSPPGLCYQCESGPPNLRACGPLSLLHVQVRQLVCWCWAAKYDQTWCRPVFDAIEAVEWAVGAVGGQRWIACGCHGIALVCLTLSSIRLCWAVRLLSNQMSAAVMCQAAGLELRWCA